MEFIGKITYVWKEELVGQNQTLKVSFVVEETDVQYPNSLCIDLFGEKTNLIKQYTTGDVVKVQLTCRAKEYNGKYFNSIGAWKIEKIQQSTSTNTQEENKTTIQNNTPRHEKTENQNTTNPSTQEDDDLPF